LEDFDPNVKIRLIGIGVSKLFTQDRSPGQLDLFEWGKYPEGAWEDVERAMDRIKERFGGGAITRGSTLPEDPETQ